MFKVKAKNAGVSHSTVYRTCGQFEALQGRLGLRRMSTGGFGLGLSEFLAFGFRTHFGKV